MNRKCIIANFLLIGALGLWASISGTEPRPATSGQPAERHQMSTRFAIKLPGVALSVAIGKDGQ